MRFSSILAVIAILLISCEEKDVRRPKQIQPLSPFTQFGYQGEFIANPFMIRVVDDKDSPMEGIVVTFRTITGSVDFISEHVATDADGVALTNMIPGEGDDPEVIVGASIKELEAEIIFTVNVSPSRTSVISIYSGNGQEGLKGTDLKEDLRVKVTDDFDNPAKNATVMFSVVTGNGQLEYQTRQTNTEGICSVGFRLSDNSTENEVIASTGSTSVKLSAESLYAPTLSPLEQDNNGIKLTWTKSPNAAFQKYVVYRAIENNGLSPLEEIENIETTSYVDGSTTTGLSYKYKVNVVTAKGTNVSSNTRQIDSGNIIELEGRATDIELDEDRGVLYASLTASNQLLVINLATKEITKRINIGSFPQNIDLSEDGTKLYVALGGSGDVAILDLNTYNNTLVSVENALGHFKVFDVMDAAPGKVYVTSNADSGGLPYIALIKTDAGNQVVRAQNEYFRFDPLIVCQYGKFLYINNNNTLYKFDIATQPLVNTRQKALEHARNKVISPDGTRIYLHTGDCISTSDFSVIKKFNTGLPAINSSGTEVYFHNTPYLTGYNTSTFEVVRRIRTSIINEERIKLDRDNSKFYILSRTLLGISRIYIVRNE